MLLSTLENYYDINLKERFQELFGNLYIGQNPTGEQNSYLVLKLNFSTLGGGMKEYKEPLDGHCKTMFEDFCTRYRYLLPEDTKATVSECKDAIRKLETLCIKCNEAGLKMFLMIDEYDHFTNDILADPERLEDYEAETHGEGYLRQFFNTIKAGTGSAIKKCFITGVSPVTMDDLTSGFNIGTNYTNNPKFNGMVGFSEEDVREMLDYYAEATGVFKVCLSARTESSTPTAQPFRLLPTMDIS